MAAAACVIVLRLMEPHARKAMARQESPIRPRNRGPLTDLHVTIDRTGGAANGRGIAAQVARELREAVRSGRLAQGTRLPSSRDLARDLGLSRGVVVEAYEQLVAEGFLESRVGVGTRVAAQPAVHADVPAGD